MQKHTDYAMTLSVLIGLIWASRHADFAEMTSLFLIYFTPAAASQLEKPHAADARRSKST